MSFLCVTIMKIKLRYKMEKPHIQIVMMGCGESGKSTTANHLIETCGGIVEKTTRKVDQDVPKVES